MLRRLRLRTKLALLIAIALVATLAVGIPRLADRVDVWRRTAPDLERAQTAVAFGDLLRRTEQEASLSGWYIGSGDPAARVALASVRPLVDRTAREIGRHRGAIATTDPLMTGAIDRVERQWSRVRTARADLDRRLVGDAAALLPFDRATAAIIDAFDTFDAAKLGANLRSRANLARLERSIGREQAMLVTGVARDRVTGALANKLRAGATEQETLRGASLSGARARADTSLDASVAALRPTAAKVAVLRAPALNRMVPFLTPAIWLRESDRQLNDLRAIGRTLERSATTTAITGRRAARDAMLRFAAILAAILVGVIVVGLVVSHAIRRPIREVTEAAAALADRQRASAASSIDGVPAGLPAVTSVAVRTRDEVGDLARAVHSIDLVTLEAAGAQRRSFRNDIGDLYVNLARRNQPLLSRQLELIDELEASEHDADRLGSIFQVDHLATRMRRNAESLLVLAGMEDLRTNTEPVPLLDVVRGAVSEIEEFERVDIVGLPPDVEVVGRVAVDFTHVLAELIENATTYSPPESRVFIGARRRPTGLELTISDEGIGVPVDRLDGLNELLSHPPLPGFDISRSLGLVVVARLCERIGAGVVLRSAAEIGTSAVVSLPLSVLRTRDHEPALVIAPDSWVAEVVAPASVAETEPVEVLPHPIVAPIAIVLPAAIEVNVEPEPAVEPDAEPDAAPDADLARPEVMFTPVPLDRDHDLLPVPGGRHARYRRRRNGRVPTNETPDVAVNDDRPPVPARPSAIEGDQSADATGAPAPPLRGATQPGFALPRRTPVRPDPARNDAPSLPARRAPSAVFELVARYEAGRRRADPAATAEAIDGVRNEERS
jgi:Histidine kinase-, DNA gyrase B-, and HSP90-like ATPase./Nitrate and nitrite sensing./HAMP domain.